jgi:hypothetical protein
MYQRKNGIPNYINSLEFPKLGSQISGKQPTEILQKLFPPTPSNKKKLNPTTKQTPILQDFDTDLSRILRRQFKLFERLKNRVPTSCYPLRPAKFVPGEIHQFQHLCILYSLLKYYYSKSLLQNAAEEDLELGCNDNIMVQGILPIHHLLSTNSHTPRKRKKILSFINSLFLFFNIPCQACHFQNHEKLQTNFHQFHHSSFPQSKRTPHSSWPN